LNFSFSAFQKIIHLLQAL